MRYKLHEAWANWDTTHDEIIAEFKDTRQAKISGQAIANYHKISFSAYYIMDTITNEKTIIERTN